MKYAWSLACPVSAVGVHPLSVARCTESIGLLRGSRWALSGWLAMGIDAGMVTSELAKLAAHGAKASERTRPWARGYTVATSLLSILLNTEPIGLHAAPNSELPWQWPGRQSRTGAAAGDW